MKFTPLNNKQIKDSSSKETVIEFSNASADAREKELWVNMGRQYLRMADQDGVIKTTKK
jgi:hypothetical protein